MLSRIASVIILMLAAQSEMARPRPAASPEEAVLVRMNGYRQTAGLPPVTLDAAGNAGCMEHARYMLLNRGTEAMAGLNAHHQNPKLPGASAAGAACGEAADLFPGVSDLDTAIDDWMSGLYHRRPILSPDLEKIGVGYAALDDGSLMAAMMFIDRPFGRRDGTGWPVAYPAKNQTGVPLAFGNEIPNPIPGSGTGGYAATLQFPPFDKVTNASAKLVDATGGDVPFYLSDPEHPATTFGQYGVISVIPTQQLQPATKYTLTITATWNGNSTTRTWSFTTVGLRQVEAADEATLFASLGHPSAVRGTVAGGGLIDAQTAYLAFAVGKPQRYRMVSIIIPMTVWAQLAGRAEPNSWTGRTVEVEATPRLVQGQYVNLAVASPTLLHAVR